MNSNLAIKEVNFNNDTLVALQDKETNEVYTAINYVLRGLGFDERQIEYIRNKWNADRVISKGIQKFSYPLESGGIQEAYCVNIRKLPLALAKINITPKIIQSMPLLAERLEMYQDKCADVLAQAFIDNKFRNKDLPFDFNFMKAVMENMQQSIMSNNKLLDTVVNTQSNITKLSTSIIDLTKYIQQRDSSQLPKPIPSPMLIAKRNLKSENNVYEITDKYYEDLRKLAETETGYIGDMCVDKIKKLFEKLKGKRVSMIFNISDEISFEKFDFEFQEAVEYGAVKSFAYFVMKCVKTRTRKRIFVCDIREIIGQRICLMDSSQVYKFRVKRKQLY